MVDILHPLTSLKWKKCRGPPEAINHDAQAVYLNEKIYVGGGYYYLLIGSRAAARLYVYTPATDTWETCNTPVYNFTLTNYRGKLVLVGGMEYDGEYVDGSPSNKLWTLSEDGEWVETLPPMETACCNTCAVSHGGYLLVIDGDAGKVRVYNGHYWAKAPYPLEHLCVIRSTVFNGDLYVIGGPMLDEKMKVYYAPLDSIIATCQSSEASVQPSTVWKRLPDVPGCNCCPVVLGDRLIAVGTTAIYAYSPSNQSWVIVGDSHIFPVLCAVVLPSNELMVISGMNVFKVTLDMAPFDPDSHFSMSALSLMEAAGIPLMSSLNNYTMHIKRTLGVLLMIPFVTPERLFRAWLQGDVEEVSPTWRNLLQIIRQLNLDDLASQIEAYFRRVTKKNVPKVGEGKTVSAVEVEGDLRRKLHSRNEFIFHLKQGMTTLAEINKELKCDNEELRNQLSLAPIKEEGVGDVEGQLHSLDGLILQLKQGMAKLTEMTKELKSENEELRSQLTLATIKEEVEEKPLTPVPVQTEVKEEAVTVTKEEPTSAQPTATWDLRGVEVCEEMTVVVHSSSAQQITWEGYGLKLHIDEGSLPAGIDQCTLSIKASLAGQYEFPENSYLISAIVWLRCEPMCKFTKPVTVEMQHCARSENIAKLNLKFVRAVCNQKQLPYIFKQLVGDFTRHSSYGVIEVNGFSGLAITQQVSEEREYCSQLFYIGHPTLCHIHFVVTWNLEAHLTVVKEEYEREKAIRGLHQPVDFESDTITLDIPLEGVSIKGWSIIPLMRPVVTKKQVDNFREGKLTPCCQLKAEVSGNRKKALIFKHRVSMKGAKYPNDVFIIDLPAGDPYTQMTFGDLAAAELELPPKKRSRLESDESARRIPQSAPSTTEYSPVVGLQWTGISPLRTSDTVATRLFSHHLSSLLPQLYEHATKWKDIGGELKFTQGELNTIQAKPALLIDAPRSWLRSMLSDWLEWAPGDGRGSTHFATLERLKDALRQANLGATAHTLHL